MKTKFFSVLFVFALFAIPVSGVSVSIPDRAEQEPRLWSGEVFNSDSNSPDLRQSIQAPVNTAANNDRTCTSDDAPEQKYSGCFE